MIFDLRLLSSVLLLHSQIELIGPFDEFFQPWIDCIGICLFGWRSNGIFIQKLIFLEVVCFATPHMAITTATNFGCIMAAAGGYAEFLNGTQLSSQSVSCLFTSLKTERAHLNEAVLVIGSQVCIGGTIDLNG